MSESMPKSRRQRVRQENRAEIMSLAREQIAAEGAAALSLRAIARAMGITAPAIYRYFPSRDDLLTALILETYTSLADALEESVAACDPHDHRGKMLAFMRKWRAWALEQPQDYMLIFTTSVPGYDAPDEVTQPAAARSFAIMMKIIADGIQEGKIHVADSVASAPDTKVKEAEQRYSHPDGTFKLGLLGWSRLHGIITLEIFNHLQPIIGNADELYESEVMTLMELLGLAE
jgi:AcrR family transcriptional regulator